MNGLRSGRTGIYEMSCSAMRSRMIVPLASLLCVASTAALCAPSSDSAASFPWRPVRLVSGFTSGGPPDTIGRIVAAKLTELLGQQGIVDNRPGAGGTIGTKIVDDALLPEQFGQLGRNDTPDGVGRSA